MDDDIEGFELDLSVPTEEVAIIQSNTDQEPNLVVTTEPNVTITKADAVDKQVLKALRKQRTRELDEDRKSGKPPPPDSICRFYATKNADH